MCTRLAVMLDLGLGYLSLERSTPTLSPGELQRLRLATQVRSNLFGVVYVLDEPSAGLHPADTEALLRALDKLKAAGNSLFVVEHELDVIRHADWVVDVGPAAGVHGGEVLYSGPPAGLAHVTNSATARYLFSTRRAVPRTPREPRGWLRLEGVCRNNVDHLDVAFPLSTLTAVTGVSGSGKSTLVSQVLVDLVEGALGKDLASEPDELELLERPATSVVRGRIVAGLDTLKRLILVDQKPIGRTPRSNLATYTGLFDHVRDVFAATPQARRKRYDAGRFSFNVAKGRCSHCEGRGVRDGRAAVHAERVYALSHLSRHPLQSADAGDPLSRQYDRRRACHDGRHRGGIFRRRPAGGTRTGGARGGRLGLPATGPAGH
jgi:excinuclease ABC subunit A